MRLTQFTPSHPFSVINISSSLNRIRLPACLHVWNQNSKLHCLQQSVTDIYRKSGSIKRVQCTVWYSRFCPAKKVHPTVMTTRFGPVRNVHSRREYDHICAVFLQHCALWIRTFQIVQEFQLELYHKNGTSVVWNEYRVFLNSLTRFIKSIHWTAGNIVKMLPTDGKRNSPRLFFCTTS